MINVTELAPETYAVDNGKGRRWTVSLSASTPRIENEFGAKLDPHGGLGLKLARLVALRFPRVPYREAG